jgi:parallel beta-helix repeat protein
VGSDTTIQNLTIDGGGTSDTGIRIAGQHNLVTRVTVQNTAAHGISLHLASNNTIEQCTVLDCDYVGIPLYQSDSNTIRDNTSSRNGAEGITVDHGSSFNVVSRNSLEDNCQIGGVGGIGIDGGRDTDNTQAARENQFVGNTISGTLHASAGITMQNNEGPSSGNVISGNVIHHAGGPGVWLKYQEHPSQHVDFNSTKNRGPTPSNANLVENNTIQVSQFPAGGEALVIDGSSSEAVAAGEQLNAVITRPNGSVVVVGNGSGNTGNVLRQNHG